MSENREVSRIKQKLRKRKNSLMFFCNARHIFFVMGIFSIETQSGAVYNDSKGEMTNDIANERRHIAGVRRLYF